MTRIYRSILDRLRGPWTELKHISPVLLALGALATMVALFGCGVDDAAADPPDSSSPGTSSPGTSSPGTSSPGASTSGALCEGDGEAELTRPAHWALASHCKGVPPDYDKLFDDRVVHRFEITIDAAVYQQTLDDLAKVLSGGGPGAPADVDQEPMWVPVSVRFDGGTWDEVGMRYKGNSSLRSAWQQGVRKLSFRLNFDKFEDDHPELKNQRFYGFKKMTFSNGFKDDSLIRDKLAADIFRDGGVPAARGAFARVYVDFGQGPVYFGLYTMIEDPSDELLGVQFADDSGNLYKPEGKAATWNSFVAEHFVKATNEEVADWSEIQAAFAALHATARQSDPAAWRAGLERVFDADHFLRCLALNQAMENWDSYGISTHNYYVYADPADGGRLKWMPWDLNEALMHGGRPGTASDSVLLDEVDAGWPLIRYLLDDPVYRQAYKDHLQAAVTGAFAAAAVRARAAAYHALIAPYVVGDEGEAAPYTLLRSPGAFEGSVAGLEAHVTGRHQAIAAALTRE